MNLVGQSVKLIMTLLVGKDLFPKLRKLVELGRLKWRVSGAGKTGLEARCQEMMKHWMAVKFFFFKPRQRNSYSILCCSPLRYEGLLGAEGKWHFNHPRWTAFPLTIKQSFPKKKSKLNPNFHNEANKKSNLSKVKTDFFISFCLIQARGIFRDRIQFPEKSEIHYPHSFPDATCPRTQINNISYYHLLRDGSKYSTYILCFYPPTQTNIQPIS